MYCCERKCFEAPIHQVDGIACTTCQSTGFCKCQCISLLSKTLYCCELKCSPLKKRNCMLCNFPCTCLCDNYSNNKSAEDMVRINSRVLSLVEVPKNYCFAFHEYYCCILKCFKGPDFVVRGVACTKCNAFNFCRCDCKTWKNTMGSTE